MSEITGVADVTGGVSETDASAQGPCQAWALEGDIPDSEICRAGSGDASDGETATVEQIGELLAGATDVVWVSLGRPNIGICTATIYPCQRNHGWRRWWAGTYGPEGGRYGGCSGCREHGAIRLDTPVVDITEVVVDGAVLDPSEYVLRDGMWLVRVNGTWPGGGEELDFSITYEFGSEVPTLVRDAVVEVAIDMWRTRPAYESPFPSGVDSVSRQGVSFSIEKEAERVAQAGMGFPALSKAVSVYNPLGQQFPSYVWSPDREFDNRVIRTFS